VKLAVLGNYLPDNSYHRRVMEAASPEVVFLGAIYDDKIVRTLRAKSLFYLHGHTVGGTNPSLVEAMAAGAPVIAHENKFNRWVLGGHALFFKDAAGVSRAVETLLNDRSLAADLGKEVRGRHLREFGWERILEMYNRLFQGALSR